MVWHTCPISLAAVGRASKSNLGRGDSWQEPIGSFRAELRLPQERRDRRRHLRCASGFMYARVFRHSCKAASKAHAKKLLAVSSRPAVSSYVHVSRTA